MPPAVDEKNNDFNYFAQWFLKNEYRKPYSDKFRIIPCGIKFYVSLFKKIVKKNFFTMNKKIIFE